MTTEITLENKTCFENRRKLQVVMFKIQKKISIPRVRLKVIVRLYRNPNWRARSLSTLMAAMVNNDTPLKLDPATSLMLRTVKQS